MPSAIENYIVVGINKDNWPAVLDIFKSKGFKPYDDSPDRPTYAAHVSTSDGYHINGWSGWSCASFTRQVENAKASYPEKQRITAIKFIELFNGG